MDDSKNPFSSKIMGRARTAGDGMESDRIVAETSKNNENKTQGSHIANLPMGHHVQIFATNVVKMEKRKPQIYAKSPKFVPYEPYPAAVKPIVPQAVKKGIKKSISRNNMDINTLITQMSQMDTKLNEYKPRPKLLSQGDKTTSSDKNNPDLVEMQKKLDEVLKENESVKEQLKQQVQVNKELKTMLVASMGEDLETQVQSLNEDKKYLADALLNSAQHLSTHQEQTEWLAGQCEVWRSKFLASSLMVEELANWKKVLSDRTEHLQQAIKQLLDERCRTREMMLYTFRNLSSLHEEWLHSIAISAYNDEKKMYSRPIGNLNMNATMPQSSNIIDLASVNLKLSENISSSISKQDISHLTATPSETEAEKMAEHLMSTPVEVKKINEEPVNALVHHAYTSSGNTPRPVASCAHCNGKVQLL